MNKDNTAECFSFGWWVTKHVLFLYLLGGLCKQMCTGKPSLHMGLQALYKGKFKLWHGTAEEERSRKRMVSLRWKRSLN